VTPTVIPTRTTLLPYEECSSDKVLQKNQAVGIIFTWQAVGDVAPYLMGMLLVPLSSCYLQFRLCFMLGCIPPAIVLYCTYGSGEDRSSFVQRSFVEQVRAGMQEPNALKNFAATSICWLIYDIAYYGSNQFTPQMTAQVFTGHHSIFAASWHGAVDMGVGIVATIHAVWALSWLGTKRLQTYGFLSIGISCVLVAVVWDPLTTDPSTPKSYTLFGIYLLFYFAVNWGAKMGAFVLPQEVYQSEFRSTFTGIAAAFGKLGAILGIWIFQVVVQHAGVMPVMVIVAVLNFGAAAISQTCISDELWTIQKAQMDEDVDGMHSEGAVVGDEDPDVVGLNTA